MPASVSDINANVSVLLSLALKHKLMLTFIVFGLFYRSILMAILRFHYQNKDLLRSQESTQRLEENSVGLDYFIKLQTINSIYQ